MTDSHDPQAGAPARRVKSVARVALEVVLISTGVFSDVVLIEPKLLGMYDEALVKIDRTLGGSS